MKIAYLMYFDHNKSNEIIAILNELTKQGDHVFVMINDQKARDAVSIASMNKPSVHISHQQEYAQEGDMSLARGTLLQMKEAFETEDAAFDWFINLPEGMLPVVSRQKIVEKLQTADADFYFVARTEKEDPSLRGKLARYYPYTSIVDFARKKKFRGRNLRTAAFLNFLGFRRKLQDPYEIGSPWFILKADTAKMLADNFAYCSENFKLAWYAEQSIIPMMIHRFLPEETHINQDLRVIGPDGAWIEDQGLRPITREVLEAHPEALFGGAFLHSENRELFNEILDRYNAEGSDYSNTTPTDSGKLNRLVDSISKQL